MLYGLLAKIRRPTTGTSMFYAALFAAVAVIWPAATTAAADASPPPDSNQAKLFGVRPVQQGQTTLPGGHFSFDLVPGQSISDSVVIENFSNHSLDFNVYGADLLAAAGGGLAPAQADDTMREAGAWIAVSTPKVTIPARSQFIDKFTLTLPSAISPGEHRGAVVTAAIVGKSLEGSSIEARTALITVSMCLEPKSPPPASARSADRQPGHGSLASR